jgi:hypothetical protein
VLGRDRETRTGAELLEIPIQTPLPLGSGRMPALATRPMTARSIKVDVRASQVSGTGQNSGSSGDSLVGTLEDCPMRRVIGLLLAGMLLLGTAGFAAADNKGPNPQPPKCVPASTPGCSDHR